MPDHLTITVSRLVCVGLLFSADPVHAEGDEVSAQIVNVLPQGKKSVLIFNRGLGMGVRVGQVARCVGPPAFTCRVSESYELRSKCVADVSSDAFSYFGRCVLGPIERKRTRVEVLEVVAEGETTTLVFDHGYRHGVNLNDWAELDGRRCRIWRIEEDRAACALEGALEPAGARRLVLVSPLRPHPGPLPAPLIAPPPTLEHPRPRRGQREPATPVAIARAHGHGLVAAQACVGFAPDERSAYVLGPGTLGEPPLPDERWLELRRIDFASGGATPLHSFAPARVTEARRLLAELVAREGLLACHAAESTARSSAGAKGLMAHHTLDRILFWEDASVVYAAMEGGAGLAERVGTGPLRSLWFVPGVAHHLGQADDRWQVLEVR